MNEALHRLPNENILLPLAESDCELTPDENKTVLREIPLLVAADDTRIILSAIVRVLLRPGKSTLSKDEGQITKLFDEIEAGDSTPAPIILCSNSVQAREAIHNIIERKVDNGVLLFDNDMGNPTGLDLFKEYRDLLPSGIVRILHTGKLPHDMESCLKNNVIDEGLVKPSGMIRNLVVKAFLKRFRAKIRQAQ